MIDVNLIRENISLVKAGVAKKQVEVDIDKIAQIDVQYRRELAQLEALRQEQKKLSNRLASAEKRNEISLGELRKRKKEIKQLEKTTQDLKRERDELLLFVPNLPHESVPKGKDESGNVVMRRWGKKPQFDFKPEDHLQLGEKLGLIDVKRASRVSGSRFYYLTGEAVRLEFALIGLAMDMLVKEGFTPVIPPVMLKEEAMSGGGYLESGADEVYRTVKDNLYLVGTSEQSILAMRSGEILPEDSLPLRYVGFSTCFRREAGSYGKDVRGIFRVHQFDKIEMFSFTHPKDSWKEHDYFAANEEKLVQSLNLPYQVVNICGGELGEPAARKYDIETWIPSQDRYRETHSTSNCTDFQARRLGIRFKKGPGASPRFVHTVNGTAVAIGRMLIAILENYQRPDGSVTIPEVLRSYLGGQEVIKAPS